MIFRFEAKGKTLPAEMMSGWDMKTITIDLGEGCELKCDVGVSAETEGNGIFLTLNLENAQMSIGYGEEDVELTCEDVFD